MSLIQRIKDKIFPVARRNAGAVVIYGPDGSVSYVDTASGAPLSLKVATVYRCVQLLSDSVAQLPLQWQYRRGDIFRTDRGDLDYLLNVEPTPAQNAFDFWKRGISDMLLDGNAYIIPRYGGGRLKELYYVPRGRMSHDTDADTYTVTYADNSQRTFSESEVIHLKWTADANAKTGVSVLTWARNAINIAQAGDSETLKRFRNGGNVKGILKNAMTGRGLDSYDDTEMQKLGEKMQAQLNGAASVIVTPGETSFEQIAMTSADMQFLESRKFAVRDICRFFGVHPSYVFDDTSNNYKSAEMANVAFLSSTLNPILRKIETELQRKLVGADGSGRQRIRYDRSGLYAMDLDSKVKYYTQMMGAGAMTVNEIRHLENLPAVEGGDTPLVSANLKTIDQLRIENQQNNEQQ